MNYKSELPFDINSFPENNLYTRDMIIHQYFKLLHGFSYTKPKFWFENYFIRDLLDMIPFLVIYPVIIVDNDQIKREGGIGKGINQEDYVSINKQQRENLIINDQEMRKKSENKGIKLINISYLNDNNGKDFEDFKQFLVTCKCNIFDSVLYIELGFLKKGHIEYLKKNFDFSCKNFLDILKIYERTINSILKTSKNE